MAKAIKRSAAGVWWLVGLFLAVVFGAARTTGATVTGVLYGVLYGVQYGVQGQAATSLVLTVDLAGNATITNDDDELGAIDGYEIWSAAGRLDPEGWVSISDQAVSNPLGMQIQLGTGALSFGELAATEFVVAEASLSSTLTFQPSAPWDIGRPALAYPRLDDLSFYFHHPEFGGSKVEGQVVFATSVRLPDFDASGLIDLQDFGILKQHYAMAVSFEQGDANEDGTVDLQDFGLLKHYVGDIGESEPAAIPEPGTLIVLSTLGLGALVRPTRRRRG